MFYHLKITNIEEVTSDIFSDCRNERLQYYDWWKNFFDKPIENNLKTNENIQKLVTGQGDGCTTGCLLDFNYFKDCYKMIAIDLSKHYRKHYSKLILLQI